MRRAKTFRIRLRQDETWQTLLKRSRLRHCHQLHITVIQCHIKCPSFHFDCRETLIVRFTKRGAYIQGNCLEEEIMQGTMPGARRRGRPRTAWVANIKSWTGLWKSQSEWQRIEINGESTSIWCGQPSDRGRLRNRTEHILWWKTVAFLNNWVNNEVIFTAQRCGSAYMLWPYNVRIAAPTPAYPVSTTLPIPL